MSLCVICNVAHHPFTSPLSAETLNISLHLKKGVCKDFWKMSWSVCCMGKTFWISGKLRADVKLNLKSVIITLSCLMNPRQDMLVLNALSVFIFSLIKQELWAKRFVALWEVLQEMPVHHTPVLFSFCKTISHLDLSFLELGFKIGDRIMLQKELQHGTVYTCIIPEGLSWKLTTELPFHVSFIV